MAKRSDSDGRSGGEQQFADEVPCRDCGELIVWMTRTDGLKKVPVDAKNVVFGETVYDVRKHTVHWDTCRARHPERTGPPPRDRTGRLFL